MLSPRSATPVSFALLPVLLVLALPRPAAAWSTNGIPFCNVAGSQISPVVSPDGLGGAVCAWPDARSGTGDIYAVRYTLEGVPAPGWVANGTPICTASGDQTGPVIATDGNFGAFIAWRDRRCGGGCIEVYLQHVLSSGAIASGWPADGLLVGSLSDPDQDGPALASDEAGGAIVVWAHGSLLLPVLPDLRAMRFTALGTTGPGWPRGGLTVCEAVFHPNPVATVDGEGGAILAWQHVPENGSDFDIQAIRVTDVGGLAPGWPPCGISLSAEVGDQTHPKIVTDEQGGAIVVWEDARSGSRDVYAQRVGADGTITTGWTPDGVAVCTQADEQHDPQPVIDGAFGAIIGWEDDRGPLAGVSDIYAQRVRSNGSLDALWPADGLGICIAADEQTHLRMISDLVGGAVLTWEDWRLHTFPDIYALRVTGAGLLPAGWPLNGVGLCTASGAQRSPVLAVSGVGGAIVVWQDGRGAAEDIYAQQVAHDGTVPVLVSLIAADAALDRVRLSWRIAFPDEAEFVVYRAAHGRAWVPLGAAGRDAQDLVGYEDLDVVPGTRYGYRLGIRSGGTEWPAGEVWIDVPTSHRFSLDAVRPNPAFRPPSVWFSLAGREPALLEVLDLAGRRVLSREVGSLGPGSHVAPLGIEAPVPGIYFLRLTQGRESRTLRVVFAR